MIDIHYLVQPTEALRLVLENYPPHDWGDKAIFILSVHIHIAYEYEFNLMYAKLILLLRIAAKKNPGSFTSRLRLELFGDPPRYSVELFNKWWAVEELKRRKWSLDYVTIMNDATADDFRKLEKTGNQDVDEWLEGIVQHRTQLETYPLDIQEAYKKLFDYMTRFVMPADIDEVSKKIQDFHASEEKKQDNSKQSDE